MNIEQTKKHWQKKLDTYLADHRLKLLLELSEPAQSMFDNLIIDYTEIEGKKYSLFFKNNWKVTIVRHDIFQVTIEKQYAHSEGQFSWLGKHVQYSKYMNGCNYEDVNNLAEVFNPVMEELVKLIRDVQNAYIEASIDILKQETEGTKMLLNGKGAIVLSNGMKLNIRDFISQITEQLKKQPSNT